MAHPKITDLGLAELLGLNKLRYLDVRGTQVTAAGVTVLRRKLPELQVELSELDATPGDSGLSPATKAPPKSPVQGNTGLTKTFSAAGIQQLRQKAAALSQPAEGEKVGSSGGSVG